MLRYQDGRFYMDGAPFSIHSGAIHYFRTLPQQWEDRLQKLKDCGLNTVETYCCWNMHEPKQGQFCFEGMLDVSTFLSLTEWGECTPKYFAIQKEMERYLGKALPKPALCGVQYYRSRYQAFARWVEDACVFCTTLVDRIVTGYPRDKASEICETALLHLWGQYRFYVSDPPVERGNFSRKHQSASVPKNSFSIIRYRSVSAIFG